MATGLEDFSLQKSIKGMAAATQQLAKLSAPHTQQKPPFQGTGTFQVPNIKTLAPKGAKSFSTSPCLLLFRKSQCQALCQRDLPCQVQPLQGGIMQVTFSPFCPLLLRCSILLWGVNYKDSTNTGQREGPVPRLSPFFGRAITWSSRSLRLSPPSLHRSHPPQIQTL